MGGLELVDGRNAQRQVSLELNWRQLDLCRHQSALLEQMDALSPPSSTAPSAASCSRGLVAGHFRAHVILDLRRDDFFAALTIQLDSRSSQRRRALRSHPWMVLHSRARLACAAIVRHAIVGDGSRVVRLGSAILRRQELPRDDAE